MVGPNGGGDFYPSEDIWQCLEVVSIAIGTGEASANAKAGP